MTGSSPSSEPTPTAQAAPPVDPTGKYASLLATGEKVLLVKQRHWLTFLEAGRWFGLALLAGVGVWFVNGFIPDDGALGFLSTLLTWAFWIFRVLGVVGIGWYVLVWINERYLVTTRRVVEAGGVLNKYAKDTALAQITDMVVGNPMLGRIFGYGEVHLLTRSPPPRGAGGDGGGGGRCGTHQAGRHARSRDHHARRVRRQEGGSPQPALGFAASPPSSRSLRAPGHHRRSSPTPHPPRVLSRPGVPDPRARPCL